MGTLVWKDTYSVGIKELDEQHKTFLDLINGLSTLDPQRVNHKEIFTALNTLVKYAQTHFDTEERYLKKYGYPHLAQQQREHVEFTMEVFRLAQDLEKNDSKILSEVVNFTKNWYRSHILGSDKEYKELLVSKGAT